MFSGSPPTCSIIYSKKYVLYLGKFWSLVWSVPEPLFHFPLVAKRCAGDEVGMGNGVHLDETERMRGHI